jgi:pimeloyl-ACP methyl ester carboxylesterase
VQRGRDDVVDWAIQRGTSFGWLQPQKGKTEYKSFTFAEGTRAELYYPAGTAPDAKLPTVVWLHGYSYPMGYMWVYRQAPDLHPILALVNAGYAVVAFDQTGHGSRTDEFATFYDRFPHWSRLGRMVADTRAAIDAAQKDGMVDPQRIYLYGYSMGGMLALQVAALDQRVKGVVSICGFTPMRSDTVDRGTGGLARYSVDLPLLPRLGAFVGNESKVPYDYNELIAAIENALGKKAAIHRLPEQPGDVPLTYADIAKARTLLAYNPHTQIAEGIPKFVEWFHATQRS